MNLVLFSIYLLSLFFQILYKPDVNFKSMKVVWILDINQNQVKHLKSVSYDENEIQSGPIWYDDGESRLFGQL